MLQGFMFAVLTLIAFKLGEYFTQSLIGGQTMAFMVLSLSQTIQAFNMRSNHSLFKIGPFSNKKLNIAVLISVLLVVAVLFTPLRVLFGLIILPWKLYLIALGLICVPFVVMEVGKLIAYLRNKNKK